MEDAELGLGRSLCFLGTTAMRTLCLCQYCWDRHWDSRKGGIAETNKMCPFFYEFKMKNNKTLKQLVYCMILVLEIFSH